MQDLWQKKKAPQTEEELMSRTQAISGWSFGQLAVELNLALPAAPSNSKGWIGQAIEFALGADAGNLAIPDFSTLDVELKTLPIGCAGKPVESTFVTSIPLLTIHDQNWHSSQCYKKLKRILWVPIEGDPSIPYSQRRIGKAFLWSPNKQQETILANDWTYLTTQIAMGFLETIDASVGEYLQIRPKAANAKALCDAYNVEGKKIKTLPRGFYLRSLFTAQIYLKA